MNNPIDEAPNDPAANIPVDGSPSVETAYVASPSPTSRPEWQLPSGVSRGTWDYVHSDIVAEDYDAYFVGNSLFRFDQQILNETFVKRDSVKRDSVKRDKTLQTIVADLGCGTGRALLPFLREGFHGVAVDLSEPMLDIVREKAIDNDLSVTCLRANLVELNGIADGSIDYAMCMFSTLGMIRTSAARLQMLRHVRRIVRSEGAFVFHVHNFWFNLRDPGGLRWVAGNILKSMFDRDWDRGDKFFQYRGVQQMFLHVFTRGELKRLLHQAGFRNLRFIPLPLQRNRPLPMPGLFQNLRANGWIVICS